MNINKISEDRLFQNNTKEEITRWIQALQYFHFLRARGGHNCEGDSFCVYFKYSGRQDLIDKLDQISVVPNKLTEEFIAFDPFESYSLDDLNKLKITIPQFNDLEQPQHTRIFGYNVHIWVMQERFEISVSGTKDGKTYKVSDKDFEVCVALEKEFERLGWRSVLDNDIKKHAHCISKNIYPELF